MGGQSPAFVALGTGKLLEAPRVAAEDVSQVGSVGNPLSLTAPGRRLSSQGDMGPQIQPDSRSNGCCPPTPANLLHYWGESALTLGCGGGCTGLF